MSRGALWPPIVVFAAHVVLSKHGLRAYRAIPGLDMVTHFSGGLAIAIFIDGLITELRAGAANPSLGPYERWTLVFSLTATTALFWEFAEFLMDTYLGTHQQIDLADTMSDMAFGVLGGTAFLLFAGWRRNRRRLAGDEHAG
jgi:hypothetical protein